MRCFARVVLCVACVIGLGAASFRPAMALQEAAPQSAMHTWEGVLDVPGRPVVVTLRLLSAGTAVTGTIQFSGQPRIPMSGVSEADALTLGSDDQGIKLNARPEAANLTGTLTLSGQSFPLQLNREPDLTPPATRSEAWTQDLEVASRKLPLYDRSMSPEEARQYRSMLASLEANVDRMSDAAIIVGLGRAVALAENAHTRLYILRNRTELRRLPIRLWWFGDHVRVVRATAPYAHLVGCEITRIGERSVHAVKDSVAPLFAGNTSWRTYMSVYSMTSPEVLSGLGLARDAEALSLRLRCGDRVVNSTLRPLPLRRRASPTEAWWDLSPAFTAGDGEEWVGVALPAPLPLYLRHPDRYYWHEYLEDRQALYVQYSRSQRLPSGPSFSEHVETIARELDGKAVTRLIIDLRFNTGGDLGLGRAAMEALQTLARAKGAAVVVISGRATFSAGLFHMLEWKAWGARIVGEQPGDELDFWSEGGNVILPNSGLYVHYANGFHAYSTREYPDFKPYFGDLNIESAEPDIAVPMTWDAYRRGDDPALRVALQERM